MNMQYHEKTLYDAMTNDYDRLRFKSRVEGREFDLYRLISIAVEEIREGQIARLEYIEDDETIRARLWEALK